jgi:hypothetical protein
MLKHTLEWRKENKIGAWQAEHPGMQETTIHVLQHAYTACLTHPGRAIDVQANVSLSIAQNWVSPENSTQ